MIRKPMRRGELVQAPGENGWTVYVAEDDSLHLLNETARAIWELCDGETTAVEMGRAVAEMTAMTWQESIAAIEETLESLEERGLIGTTS